MCPQDLQTRAATIHGRIQALGVTAQEQIRLGRARVYTAAQTVGESLCASKYAL